MGLRCKHADDSVAATPFLPRPPTCGRRYAQTLVLVEKTPEGDVVESPGIDVRFVPLTSTKEQLEPSGHTD